MTYARSILVPPGSPGTYHCVSRCVLRAWLCGEDRESGRSYEHRRQWVEDRIGELAGFRGLPRIGQGRFDGVDLFLGLGERSVQGKGPFEILQRRQAVPTRE